MKNQLLELRELLITAVHTIDKMYPLEDNTRDRLPSEVIVNVGAKYYGVEPEELHTKGRGIWAQRRQVLCAVLYNNMEGASLQRVATLLGYKTHDNVLHHVRIVNDALDGVVYGYGDIVKDYKEILRRLYVTE